MASPISTSILPLPSSVMILLTLACQPRRTKNVTADQSPPVAPKQIPYDLTKGHVEFFLPNHAKLITPNLGPAIHIIMDRPSGKTMDCFVEFLSVHDARNCVNTINLSGKKGGLMDRINDRLVDVRLSSQDELLGVLFPKAKNVTWVNGVPVVRTPQDEWSTGFKTFVTAEELGLMIRHAEQPHRVSSYSSVHVSFLPPFRLRDVMAFCHSEPSSFSSPAIQTPSLTPFPPNPSPHSRSAPPSAPTKR